MCFAKSYSDLPRLTHAPTPVTVNSQNSGNWASSRQEFKRGEAGTAVHYETGDRGSHAGGMDLDDGGLTLPAGRQAQPALQDVVSGLESLHAELVCPLCAQLFKDPVSVSGCEDVFCRACLLSRLEGVGFHKSDCPVCKKPFFANAIRSSFKLQSILEHVTGIMGHIQV